MSHIPTVSTRNPSDVLLEEIIAKAKQKGAMIKGWYQSPNGRTVIEIAGRLPIFYLSKNAAMDSLIHQYNLIAQYRHLYQNIKAPLHPHQSDTAPVEHNGVSNLSKAIYECDVIFGNMDNELSTSTRRKLFGAIQKIKRSDQLNSFEFYSFQNELLKHFRNKVREYSSTSKKKQLQMFIHFLSEITFADIE